MFSLKWAAPYLLILAYVLFFLFAEAARAEKIEFSDEELARETVLPVFSKQIVVRDRAVTLAKRFEIGLGAGLNLIEPFYQQTLYNITAAYHFDELRGINFNGYLLNTGLSDTANKLKNGQGIDGKFDVSLAPQVENLFFVNYQLTAYYGKISVTKQTVMNLSLYGLAGIGMVNWSDGPEIALDFGIGQKLYFTPNFGFRADLTIALYQGPEITSRDLDPDTNAAARSSGDFDSTFFIRPFLTGSLIYVF